MKKSLLRTEPLNMEGKRKTCVWCGVEKEYSEFPKHRGHKDRYDSRCKGCINKQSKLRRELKKTAPPRPSICDCCGNVPKHNKKIVLDHCHEKSVFRGWLCDQCNVGIGNLGDNLAGLERAVVYLKNTHKQQNGEM